MDKPVPRYEHCSVYVDGRVVLWGGRGKNRCVIPATELDTLGTTSGQWETVSTTGTAPLATTHSATVVLDSSTYSFGGRDANGKFSRELHCLTSDRPRWKQIPTSNPLDGPRPKISCGMVRRGRDELVVVGGWLDDDSLTNELHCVCLGDGEYLD